jgi:hypothetical protein
LIACQKYPGEVHSFVLEQISRKREATMGIITAKADAERSRQEALTVEEQGKKNVMVDRYAKDRKQFRR